MVVVLGDFLKEFAKYIYIHIKNKEILQVPSEIKHYLPCIPRLNMNEHHRVFLLVNFNVLFSHLICTLQATPKLLLFFPMICLLYVDINICLPNILCGCIFMKSPDSCAHLYTCHCLLICVWHWLFIYHGNLFFNVF